MERYHPLKELAPRDVVSRSIVMELRATGDSSAFLDLTGLPSGFVRDRFPRIYQTCLRYGIDLETTPAPVRPAAHYAMGGVKSDLFGRSTMPRLFAAGEAACTGVHGANRLASNSLLESVVYPERIARDVKTHARAERGIAGTDDKAIATRPYVAGRDDEWRAVRREMYANVGVERDEAGLGHALAAFRALAETTPSDEVRDAATTAALIAQSALRRRETRGSHVRLDYPGSALHSEHSFATLADLVPSA